jgi:hypothetical protein
MKDCCEGVEFTDPVAQVHVEDDCTVVVELDGVGAQGPPGTAATVNVGTTSTLSAGSPATVANSGTQNAAILDFGIPEGPQGTPGLTGDTGVEIAPAPPSNTDVLWLDTLDPSIAALAVSVLSDYVAPYSYIGVAVSGSSTAALNWRVTRIDVGPPVVSQVADPIAWDDRLIAVYS